MARTTSRSIAYSSHVGRRDFCSIFHSEMNTLYSLAFLLTADHARAEQVFLAAFNDCMDGADVFPGWERSWTRRAIVKNAIRVVRPRYDDTDAAFPAGGPGGSVPVYLLELRPFDRFVFAMTVLERFTARETAVLLQCMPSDVERARVRVLRSLGLDGSVLPAGSLASTAPLSNEMSTSA